jgi:hypothetical protein
MGLRAVQGDVALPLEARGAGTHVSGPVANAGAAADVAVLVHCTAATGTSPTLNVSLEESADGTTWTAVAGSGTAQLIAAGSAQSNARVSASFIRVTSTVGGTTPSVTYRVAILAIAE